MATLTALQKELLRCIADLLSDYDVVQLRLCCRHLQRAIKPPRTTQLCPGTWRVPQSALPDLGGLVRAAVEEMDDNDKITKTILQWSYLLDFTGKLQ